jgi:hypothetical protein
MPCGCGREHRWRVQLADLSSYGIRLVEAIGFGRAVPNVRVGEARSAKTIRHTSSGEASPHLTLQYQRNRNAAI